MLRCIMLSEAANILSIIAYNIDQRHFMSKIIEGNLRDVDGCVWAFPKRIEHAHTNRICVRYGYIRGKL